MGTSLATVENLATRLGETITETPRAEWFLDTASGLIRAYTGLTWLDDDLELESVPPDVVRICVEIAARVWINPEGLTQETTGPFTERRPDQFADGFFLTNTCTTRTCTSPSPRNRVTPSPTSFPARRVLMVSDAWRDDHRPHPVNRGDR
jgi:hypothetical protein